MKEHALPQDVTGYKFHIIGNMTLKQFAEVGVGVGIGFGFYFTNLPNIIKWPLILIVAGTGALAAFVPFEERPLDQWILTLFKALYRPTQFYWKRTSKIPEPFLFESKTDTKSLVKEVDLNPARRQRVKEYLHSVVPVQPVTVIDEYNSQRLNEVMMAFDQPTSIKEDIVNQAPPSDTLLASSVVTSLNFPVQAPTPQPVVSSEPTSPAPSAPADTVSQSIPSNKPLPKPNIPSFVSQIDPLQQPQVSFKDPLQSSSPQAGISLDTQLAGVASGIQVTTSVGQSSMNLTPATVQPVADHRATVAVPQMQSISVAHTVADDMSPRTSPQELNQIGDTYMTSQTRNITPGPQATQVAVQDKNLPFPAKPTEPNKVVGMALDQNDKPISNVIVEILTTAGISARAVKTNILGQFFITTPLGSGVYTIAAEKTGYTFPLQSLELTGAVVDPVLIKAQ